ENYLVSPINSDKTFSMTSDLCAAPSTHFERALPQWLTGIVAVCGFLVLTFMAFLVKKVWCENPKAPVRFNPYSTSLESIRTTCSNM
uniref:Uncharacterized protein n=1 Tax=Cyprinodon variegatus TaxID=28743 RepID=A0A3Q2E3X5_CYPVA